MNRLVLESASNLFPVKTHFLKPKSEVLKTLMYTTTAGVACERQIPQPPPPEPVQGRVASCIHGYVSPTSSSDSDAVLL